VTAIFEQTPESASPPRPPLAPPPGPVTGVRAIFWNEHELRAGWRLLLFILIVFLFIFLASGLALLLHLPVTMRISPTPGTMLAVECTELCAVLAAAAIMSLAERRPFGVYGLPRASAFGAAFWQGAMWGLGMIAALIGLIRAFGGFSFAGLALAAPAALRYGVVWALVFLCVGFFEEFMFRGYAQFTLAMGIGFWPAAVALSGGFGAVHLFNGGEDKVGALSVFVVGMFFCLTLRRTGSLWFVVGLHGAFDWGESYLFSVPDSGIVTPGHLLNTSLHGPAWLTGGTVGPEGSVMAFVVIAVAAALFALLYPVRAVTPPQG
jgi:membrane protease YdiL (CAAX protease family)